MVTCDHSFNLLSHLVLFHPHQHRSTGCVFLFPMSVECLSASDAFWLHCRFGFVINPFKLSGSYCLDQRTGCLSSRDQLLSTRSPACANCPMVYIGQTGRRQCQRLSEHKRAIRTADFNSSAMAEHVWTASHPVDWENTCILSSCPDYHSRLIQEAIHIQSTDHTLNRDTGNLYTISVWWPSGFQVLTWVVSMSALFFEYSWSLISTFYSCPYASSS